ncbi:zinc-dependent metalloprotease [Flavivirga abyssicola]|uniref:zinc-dependent metalloprotease n=1 Tax=Flavivirga abyssicola TaxID=3063533 RepID=UPI0026DF8D58|nr:zinc-dependent metalloprotease [Flavivirga sp. MEBiC07777]WVK13808.1 zinc-dependent metalloprotease [Flavivirga sp. MEBiC07777]
MKYKITILLSLLFALCLTNTAEAQLFKKKKKKTEQKDTIKKPKPKKDAIKPYDKVITKEAKTDTGLFDVHKIGESYFYEIQDSLLGREMLMVTRIAKTATGIDFGGNKNNTQMLRWEKKNKKILLRVVSHRNVAADSLPIYESVVNSNFEPILYAFDIKAYNKKNSLHPATVIDVTKLFTSDVNTLNVTSGQKKAYKIGRLDASRSFIESIKSYPLNIEARHVKTYPAGNAPSNKSLGAVSVEMNNSMILLPKKPMKRRYFDERVGWFNSRQVDFGLEAHKSKTVTYIDRWRLEVKDEDIEKFKRGELVEPKKQIVYYIDRATPKKWVPYIKAGIEDWQVAFEDAGFKNAIIAKEPPTPEEDPEWSPEDVRYSVVRYLASNIPNANGPHVSDPRSGEILESDINWYHNIMTLVHNWFFVQTAAINPDARSAKFKDEVMGTLIRFVSSHEVGHTLGLPHNMGSSSAYPVDSLRSATFTKKYGTAPSIMDYARFNYIAQPEDKDVYLYPKIGVYDKYSINWGYRPILNTSAENEKGTLNKWILKHTGDPLYRFGAQQYADIEIIDPSSQTEDLGNDAIKASNYGIKNLKRIVPNLRIWLAKDSEDYDDLKEIYDQLIKQYSRYMGHVVNNIGGIYEDYKTFEQAGAVYTHVDKTHQKKCLNFIQDQLFKTPKWLIDPDIFNKIEASGYIDRIRGVQVRTLNRILAPRHLARSIENEAINGNNAYKITDIMGDLRNGLWKELYAASKIDVYRRNLQKAHVERLAYLITAKSESKSRYNPSKSTPIFTSQSDIPSVAKGELRRLKQSIRRAIPKVSDKISKYHLEDIVERIDHILEIDK